jgi:hypothetical protein
MLNGHMITLGKNRDTLISIVVSQASAVSATSRSAGIEQSQQLTLSPAASPVGHSFLRMAAAFESGDVAVLKEVAEYCIQDSVLVVRLFDKVQSSSLDAFEIGFPCVFGCLQHAYLYAEPCVSLFGGPLLGCFKHNYDHD